MNEMVAFINLFFVPMLPLYIIYKKVGKPLKLTLEFFMEYCITAVLLIPMTKIILFLPTKLLHASIYIYSGYYTMAELIPAAILSWVGIKLYLKIGVTEVLEAETQDEEFHQILERYIQNLRELRKQESFRRVASQILFAGDLLLLDVSLRLANRGIGITPFRSLIPWLFTFAWIAMLAGLIVPLPQRGKKIAMSVIGGIYILLFLTNCVMRRAKGTFFSFNSLLYAQDGLKFLDIAYFQIPILLWLMFFFSIIVLVAAVRLVPKCKIGRWQVIVAVALLVGGSIAININRERNLTDRLQNHFNIYQNSLLYDNFTDPNSCMMLCGMYQYTFRDFCITYGVYDSFDQMSEHDTVATLDAWYNSKEADEDNAWTGRFAGKNLIMIQLEAIDTWLVNKQFMPNLYRIQQESIDFVNHYTPMYSDAGTFNTEMIVNTGMVAPFVGAKSSMYSRNTYPYSLANLMKLDGREVNSFHRSNPDVYNRGVIHQNWGYEQYYSGADMGIPNDRLDFDTELMQAYDQIAPAGESFFSFIITYSGHGAYVGSAVSDEYYDYAASLLPEGTNEMVIHAMAHAWETDLFIGELYHRLEEEGRLDDTVLVFYSDHYDYYVLDNDLIMEQKGVSDMNMINHTPFFIYEKNTAAEKIEKVTSTIDVLPTLANLFELDTDGRYYVGNDAFSTDGGYAIFKDFSWYDGQTYFNTMDNETVTPEISQRNAELQKRLEMSWDTMKINYFR